MTCFRHISAWILVVAFAVGGVVGPVAHRVGHGQERLAAAGESCHPPAAHHTDVPVWTGESADVDLPECDLCARRLLVVLPSLVPPSTPRVDGPTRVQVRTHVAPIHVVADRSIRGPPSRDGIRLT